MTKMKNARKAQETAENRMTIIAPLLAPGLGKLTVGFTHEEDSATLGSDMSVSWGLQGAMR